MNQNKQHTQKYDLYEYYHKKKAFFKSDILIIALIVVAIIISLFFILNTTQGQYVEVYHKGELIERHLLSDNITIVVDKTGHNEIRIKDNTVSMYKSDCKNQVCVKTGEINKSGQRIICAPNGIVVLITGRESLDGITGGGHES